MAARLPRDDRRGLYELGSLGARSPPVLASGLPRARGCRARGQSVPVRPGRTAEPHPPTSPREPGFQGARRSVLEARVAPPEPPRLAPAAGHKRQGPRRLPEGRRGALGRRADGEARAARAPHAADAGARVAHEEAGREPPEAEVGRDARAGAVRREARRLHAREEDVALLDDPGPPARGAHDDGRGGAAGVQAVDVEDEPAARPARPGAAPRGAAPAPPREVRDRPRVRRLEAPRVQQRPARLGPIAQPPQALAQVPPRHAVVQRADRVASAAVGVGPTGLVHEAAGTLPREAHPA